MTTTTGRCTRPATRTTTSASTRTTPSVLFAGDLVFANGSFGRTDLNEGNRDLLVDSIDRVRRSPTRLSEMHTGHGPSVTERPFDDVELAVAPPNAVVAGRVSATRRTHRPKAS